MSRDDYLADLRDSKKWVCWTYEKRDGKKTKPPIAPFDSSKYAKSNDKSTWGTYSEAVDYHARDDTDTEGVGFMLDGEGVVVGVDLDGCRHPDTGELEPWAEDIVDELDTYTEVSPSGTGLRLFVVGLLPDGRNKRKQERTLDLPEWVEENKNAEVEVYDRTRYMTYTGEHVDGTPTEAKPRNDTLRRVHEEYVADSTDESGRSRGESASGGSVDLSGVDGDGADSDTDSASFTNEFGQSLAQIREWSEKLDDVLTHLEPGYPLPNDDDSPSGYDQSAASMLYWWRFSDSDIARIIRRFRPREKLKRDDYLERTISKAKGGDQCDPPRSVNTDDIDEPEQAAAVLDAKLQRYERDDADGPESEERRRIGKLLGMVPSESFDSFRERAANVLDTSESALSRHRDLMEHYLERGPVYVANGKTWYLGGTPLRQHEILNFEIDVKSFLQVPGEPRRADLQVSLETGEEFRKRVEPKIFNQRQRFDDELLSERFGMTFDPGPRGDDDTLDVLNKYIAHADAPTRAGTHHIGLHSGEWVTPDGSLTPDGWTDDPKTVYLERNIGIERRVSLPSDTAEYDTGDVAQILRELPFTRDSERLLPVLGWFYAAPFRPHIKGGDEFNLLNVTGDTGSGKTTTLRYLWRCFGMKGEPFDCKDTTFALLSTLGATNSLPVWFDEYKPGDMANYEVKRFHDVLRKTATGSVAQRGNADKTTTEYELKAPSVVSGEQQIQNPAERRRSVMTAFRTSTTQKGTDTRRAFNNLVGNAHIENGELVLPDGVPDPSNHALAYLQYVTSLDTSEIHDRWHRARERVYEFRQSWDGDHDLDDLEVQGLQTIVFGWSVYQEFATAHGVDADELPGDSQLDDALQHVANEAAPSGSRKSHMDRFVELISRAAAAEYLHEGEHYTHVREGKRSEELRFNLNQTFDAVSKYCRDHGLDGEDLLNTAEDYRKRFRNASEQEDSYVRCHRKPTSGVGRAVGIQTLLVMQDLEYRPYAFERSSEVCGEETAESSDDSDSPGPGEGTDKAPTATADGGTATADTDTVTEAYGRVKEHVRTHYDAGDHVTPGDVAGQLAPDLEPKQVRDALARMQRESTDPGLTPFKDGYEVV